MMRAVRIATALLFAATLAGCGNDSDFEQLGGVLLQNLSSVGGDGPAIPRAQAAAVPYASIGVRYGSNPEAMLVLATKSGDDSEWLAGTQASIVTRNGRIIRTVGLPYNLTGFQGPIGDADAASGTYHYLYDLADRRIFGAIVNCTLHDMGAERIEIIGGSHDTHHIVETCNAPQLDWDFQNDFWRDMTSGYVWKSVQNVHPDADPVTLEALRPEE
jgi:hypothetical protein